MAKTFSTVEQLLDYAIERERAAHDFYMKLADVMSEKPWIAEACRTFAKEELGHEERLKRMKENEIERLSSVKDKVENLKVAETVEDVKIGPDMDYAQVLTVAMKREKASYKLYNDLADSVEDADLKRTFKALAVEEAKHKLRFEIEYDEVVMSEN